MRSAEPRAELLVVEDSPTQAHELTSVLERNGYSVTVAANGEEALGAIATREPAMVLSDVVMPGMGGYELCSAIKGAPALEHIPVVLVASLSDVSDVLRALESGADAFVTKPYDDRYLLSRVRRILDGAGLPCAEPGGEELKVTLDGRSYVIGTERARMLNLLLSSYEAAVRKKRELTEAQEELRKLNETLEENVEQRTAALGGETAERRRAAEALRESEDRYRRLFEESNDAVFIHTVDGRILDVNRRASQMAGLSEEKLKTMQIQQLQTEEPVPTDSDFKDTSQSGSMRFESRITRPDGRLVDVDVSARLVDTEKGTVQAIFRDITERKHAEQELARERQFSNAVIQTAGALIVVLDTQGRIVQFNRACEEATGLSIKEMKGRSSWEVLIPPEEREAVQRAFQDLTEETDLSTCENNWLTKDGKKRLISWTNSRVLDDSGQVQWVIATGIDVTEQRQLEEQLRRATKLEAVGQLAGGVAHDFNNLLTAILGYVDLDLAEVPEQTSLHEDLKRIRAAARRASDLTRQLLAFSRQQAARPEVLDLNATVENVSKMLGHLIEENVELELDLSEEPLTVRADPAQLEQVLMNLAVNARDAMPDGGLLRIETASVVLDEAYVRMHADARAGPHAVLAVTDTGVGMPPEVRERIFDPFFTTKEVGQGTGLGLSTVYGIAQQHGGSTQCYSEPNIGTTFKVYLPLAGAEQAAAAEESVFEMGIMGEETILLAEDEASVRDLAARVLQDAGYTVLCAADGAEAMSLVREHGGRIDLILTDVVMPKVNGPAMAREARSRCPGVKLLFMSGYAGNPVERMGQNMVEVPILRKPFTARNLTQKVRHVLDEA